MKKLGRKEFDRIVQHAIDLVPDEILDYLDNVLITVQNRPSHELLEEMGLPPDEPLLGVYQGVSLPEQSPTDPVPYPDTIILFQEPLEEICDSVEELEREIQLTIAHEIAHFFGIDDDRLRELGYE